MLFFRPSCFLNVTHAWDIKKFIYVPKVGKKEDSIYDVDDDDDDDDDVQVLQVQPLRILEC